MSAKWTPGPWQARESAMIPGRVYVEGPTPDGKWLVAEACGRSGENLLNARLIAAAPEEDDALLSLRNEVAGILGVEEDALRVLLGNTNVNCLKRRVEQADAALAKARGESENV